MTEIDVSTPPLTAVMEQTLYQFRVMAAGVAFWTAVALPFVYIPLLLTGLNGPSIKEVFAVLILAHIGSLVIGHRYPRV